MKSRYRMALGPEHFLANIMDPRYKGHRLGNEEVDEALQWVSENKPECLVNILNLRAQASPFQTYMFQDRVEKTMQPLDWWISQKDRLGDELISLANQIFVTTAASANVERVFSIFGLVHSKLRNRLGIDKANKLVFLYKTLNDK